MPVHKIPAHALHEDLQRLEREGESVNTITPIHDGLFFVVTTRFHGNNIEHRGYETPADIKRRLDAQEQRAEWDAR